MGQIIYDIPRTEGEIIRVEVSEFKGHDLINMRTWYSSIDTASGNLTYKPTQKGFALKVERFGELKEAVRRLELFLSDREKGIQPEQFQEAKTEDIQEQE